MKFKNFVQRCHGYDPDLSFEFIVTLLGYSNFTQTEDEDAKCKRSDGESSNQTSVLVITDVVGFRNTFTAVIR